MAPLQPAVGNDGHHGLYAAYSITAVSYNTPYAIAVDYLIQLKPYIAFAVFVAVERGSPTPTAGYSAL